MVSLGLLGSSHIFWSIIRKIHRDRERSHIYDNRAQMIVSSITFIDVFTDFSKVWVSCYILLMSQK